MAPCLEVDRGVGFLTSNRYLLILAVVVGCGENAPEELGSDAAESTPEPSAEFLETKAKAEEGDANAQHKLGAMYRHDEGVDQDFKEAAKWFRKAAEQGDALAETYLQMLLKEHPELRED